MTPEELAAVAVVDSWLDSAVAPDYRAQPLAQDWARVAKVTEEAGEAVAELIAATGQNPRKPQDPEARDRLLGELADVALTALLAIQHFTKSAATTDAVLTGRLERILGRVPA